MIGIVFKEGVNLQSMNFFRRARLANWLPQLNYQVWILATGRLLSQMGSGFTLFYAPIFFVNQVGLSATAVGIGLGSQSILGVVGRVMGGSLSDGRFGRKRTLLFSAVVSAIACFILAAATNFPVFVIGNLLLGFGIGLYWPSAEAMVADLSTPEQRSEAFALNRLCDSLGLGLGVVLGGLLIGATGAYRSLFVIDGVSFLVLFVVVCWAITEVYRTTGEHSALNGWGEALRDRQLLTYCFVNVLFTTYIVQVSSTMPLYFTNFVPANPFGKGFNPLTISALFTWHLVASVVCQLPVARVLNRISRPHALMLSAVLWGAGFVSVWLTGVAPTGHIAIFRWVQYGLCRWGVGCRAWGVVDAIENRYVFWAVLALGILALATVTYLPSASAIVVDLAPESLRGIYLAVNSQCWAIGYFIGPLLGGWAMDQPHVVAHSFWLGLALSITVALVILQQLQRVMRTV